MLTQPVVLFSTPRSGSTWVQEYVSEYNKTFGYLKILPYEFLNENFFKFKINSKEILFNNLNEKQNYLESNKISFKVHIDQLFDVDWANRYFQGYYKIKLLRKNVWNQFASYIVQSKNSWDHKLFYIKSFRVTENDIDEFLNLYKKSVNCNLAYNEIIYYEDLSTELLENKFNIDSKKVFTHNQDSIAKRRNNYFNNIENYNNVKELFFKKLQDSSLVI